MFSCLMADVRLKPTPILLGFSFDLQEHKSHNNAALVMDHIRIRGSEEGSDTEINL